ncbi:MAG: XRE family transcriptional regulator [Candidatus Marinimicrobia bacterium CG1_02_48_14]|nr:MAG: XRE family transcriptional regulator [Candidatus Marinimicrobia bacterium CG1_02_48_14]
MNFNEETMYQAFLQGDSSMDGAFFVAVKTTGIFCRPTCKARKPLRKNIEFYESAHLAMIHGFRPCKVCVPLAPQPSTPDGISHLIRAISSNPEVKITDQILREKKLEPNRVRRWFKQHHGITFHAYQRMVRINTAFKKIKSGESVTQTAFDAGYESLSGFNDSFKAIFGVAPSNSKHKNIIDLTRIETPLGIMIAGASTDGICLLEFSDRRMLETEFRILGTRLNATLLQGENDHFATLRIQLQEYFAGKRKEFSVPLVLVGSPFQEKVWRALLAIPFGETRSYQAQANAIQNPTAVRAVANANGMNKISIIVPCHRVIGSNGKLIGYGGGLWRKEWLLAHEGKFSG